MFKSILDFILGLFNGSPASQPSPESSKPVKLPAIIFLSVIVKDNKIGNSGIGRSKLYCQVHNNKNKWVMFRCPCNCGDVVTLSLQPLHRPFWKLSLSPSKRPTLHPSVWRDKGCFSHFWVKDGRVFWCVDTGSDPRFRKFE